MNQKKYRMHAARMVLGSVGVGVVGPLVGRRRAQKIEGKGSGGEAK